MDELYSEQVAQMVEGSVTVEEAPEVSAVQVETVES
jgi:hypothetical protein